MPIWIILLSIYIRGGTGAQSGRGGIGVGGFELPLPWERGDSAEDVGTTRPLAMVGVRSSRRRSRGVLSGGAWRWPAGLGGRGRWLRAPWVSFSMRYAWRPREKIDGGMPPAAAGRRRTRHPRGAGMPRKSGEPGKGAEALVEVNRWDEWDGLGRRGTGMGRFWDELGVLERGFWGENEGLGRNGTIWDGFGGGVGMSPRLEYFVVSYFIYMYLR